MNEAVSLGEAAASVVERADRRRDVMNVNPAPVPVPEDVAGAALSMIERAARDPNVDVDKFERLLRMKREVEAEEAKRAYNAAMAACQAEMPAVARKAQNTQTNSKYATLESVSQAIQPIYTKHGFGLSFDTADSPLPNHYRVTCEVTHSAGHVAHRHVDIPVDSAGIQGKVNKTPTHAFGSTMSYGRRYLTLLIFNVATKNEDDDGQSAGAGDLISEEQLMQLRELIEAVEADEEKFAKFMRAERLDALPAKKFEAAVNALNDFGRKNGKIK